jgi:hypothetical protein
MTGSGKLRRSDSFLYKGPDRAENSLRATAKTIAVIGGNFSPIKYSKKFLRVTSQLHLNRFNQ